MLSVTTLKIIKIFARIKLSNVFFFLSLRRPLRSTLFPYTTLFRSLSDDAAHGGDVPPGARRPRPAPRAAACRLGVQGRRSEEHTSELQSRGHLVCRLLLEKKKKR